ncbi:helix-turn-helix transcriptional regulator [Thiomicrorhabdus sp.]|uniref:helix-turn-helix transcriptional regulator n=1 Tax=Thiomicrorhabdus sp. TaxID=2039724 RepID=UPI003561E284
MQSQSKNLSNSPCSSETNLFTDTDLLQKITHIQACLIYGHNLQAILKTEVPFITETTESQIMAICLNQKDKLQFEFVLDAKKQLVKNLKKLNVTPNLLNLNTFADHHRNEMLEEGSYLKLNSLQEFFEGALDVGKCQQLELALHFEFAIILPIFSYEAKKIGYSIFLFQKNQHANLVNLKKINTLFQTIIQPLYAEDTKTFHSKCNRVCTEMPMLTGTEKRILKLLLQAKSYPKIADELNISLNTVKTHMKNIFSKYEVHSKLALYNKIKGNNF